MWVIYEKLPFGFHLSLCVEVEEVVKCIWGEDACILYSGFSLQGECCIRNFYLDAHQWPEFIINMLEQGSVCVCVCVGGSEGFYYWYLTHFTSCMSYTVLRTVLLLPRPIYGKPLIHSVSVGYIGYPSTLSQRVPYSGLIDSGNLYETEPPGKPLELTILINLTHSEDVTWAFRLLSPSQFRWSSGSLTSWSHKQADVEQAGWILWLSMDSIKFV